MKPVRVTRYRCDHCPRTFSSSATAAGHELRCFFNPQRQPFEDELYPWIGAHGREIWPRLGSEHELGESAGWEPDGGPESLDYLRDYVYLDGEWRPVPAEIAREARRISPGYEFRRFGLWRGVAVFLGESVEARSAEKAALGVITSREWRPGPAFDAEDKEMPF